MIDCHFVQHGFKFGSAEVTRCMSDKKKGWVVIEVKTPKNEIQVYCTKTGKIRVHDKQSNEWKPKK